MAFDTASRFKLVEDAILAPGKCLVTGTSKGPFVDLNRDMQFSETGRAYLSVDVVRELAEGAGILDELRAHISVAEQAAYDTGYDKGVSDHADFDAAASRLGNLVDRIRRPDPLPEPEVDEGEGDDEPLVLVADGSFADPTDKAVDAADGELGEAPGQSDESGSDERSVVVPSGSGDGTNPFRI